MGEPAGIKETQEAALALIAIGAKVMQLRKQAMLDGKLDIADVAPAYVGISQDPEFLAVVHAGAEKIDQVPAEIADLKFNEGIQLVGVIGPAVVKALASLK